MKAAKPADDEPEVRITWACADCKYAGNLNHWAACGHCGSGHRVIIRSSKQGAKSK